MNSPMQRAYECLIRKLDEEIKNTEDEHRKEIYLWIQKEDKIFDFLVKKIGYTASHDLAQLLDQFHKEQTGTLYGHESGFEERYEHLEPKEKK